jgi:DNA-binding transcriptional LysR family regulator
MVSFIVQTPDLSRLNRLGAGKLGVRGSRVVPPDSQSTGIRYFELLDTASCGMKPYFMKPHALDGMAIFTAVAEARNFRVAGERLGVSASAVSQALRKLEARLGVPLVQRTTRSVRLTEAGERLYAAVRPALEEVAAAVAAVGELSDEPRGTLRLLIGTTADPVLARLPLAGFLTAHPHVRLDVVVSDAVVDIVAAGFDAGIQLGEVIDRDMIAVPVTGDIRMTLVGSPAYFERHPKPKHPRDLVAHECLNWHPVPEAPAYRWEFTEPGRKGNPNAGRELVVAAPGRVLSTDPAVNIRLARDGFGLTIVYADMVRDEVASGELVPVLEEFCEPFPGYYMYYPQRRHAGPALRALIDHMRRTRQPASGESRRREASGTFRTSGEALRGIGRRRDARTLSP